MSTQKNAATAAKAAAANVPVEEYHDVQTKFEAYNGHEPFLFVSYSHRNVDQVYPILDLLYDRKYRIWYDESCETGNDFREELRDRIERCEAILLFVSQASMSSPFCGMEIIVARENHKRIYPIYLDDAEVPPAFQILLSNTHHGAASNIPKLIKSLVRDLPATTMDRLTTVEDRLIKCEDNGNFIQVDEGVRIICDKAFRGRQQLTHISLPESLEIIESEAFRACGNLQEMDIPESTYHIGESAFRDCLALEKLTIRNGLIKIGERAFENCPVLTDISLPDGLAEIYASAFNGCKKLKSIKLPHNLTVIGENAFADCISLDNVVLPENVIKIDDLVFSGCSALKSVSFPQGLKKIGKAAFKNCHSLVNVTIPASVIYLSTDLFRGCEAMRSIQVDPRNKHYKSEPNKRDGADHVLFNKNKSMIIAYPAASREVQYDVPDSVTVISDWTFSECRKLNRITIPDSVNEIGEGAFCNCVLLDELIIPDSVEKIDDCAFRGCRALEKIVIPASVTELGWGLFDGCKESMIVYCDVGTPIHEYCVRNKICNDRIENIER